MINDDTEKRKKKVLIPHTHLVIHGAERPVPSTATQRCRAHSMAERSEVLGNTEACRRLTAVVLLHEKGSRWFLIPGSQRSSEPEGRVLRHTFRPQAYCWIYSCVPPC